MLKLNEDYHTLHVNSENSMQADIELYYTLYPNDYMVVRPHGHYTKHYFVGSQRLVSKIGNTKDYLDPTESEGPLADVKSDMEALIDQNLMELGMDLDFTRLKVDTELGMTDENNEEEIDRYFYTLDQVGSSCIVTSATGDAIQYIGYMPFGDSFVDIKTSKFAANYRFTGKEQDMETGLYYYGARYYDSRIGRFMSVDPLADQFPGWNPYNYTLNNPINMIDPDGRAPQSANGGPGDPKNFTVSIGIHTRGSALVTGSINFGIMIDNQGTFATYKENTLGGGLIAGASSAVNVGVHDGDVMAQKGKGWNMGFDAVVFGGELNMRDIKGYPGHEFLDVFKGGNIDTPAGFGLSAGIYFERSDVDFLSGGTLDYFFENSNTIFDQMGVPEDKRAEFMQHIQQVNNAINENNCQDECIEK